MGAVTLVHSSDVHVGTSDLDHAGDQLDALRSVVLAAHAVSATVLVLAGDVFDHRRVPRRLIGLAATELVAAPCPVIILPGNHDCLGNRSVYGPGRFAATPNVTVLGVSAETSRFPDLDLEIWGRPHRDQANMAPLPDPPPRQAARRIVVGHGHWARSRSDDRYSWLITEEDIAATDADYVALGHWDIPARVGDGSVPAYYSGSPFTAGSVNVVTIDGASTTVDRRPLAAPLGASVDPRTDGVYGRHTAS